MELVCHHGQNDQFLMSNEPSTSKPPIFQFSFALIHHIFWSYEIPSKFLKKFKRTPVKTLSMEPVGNHDKEDLF